MPDFIENQKAGKIHMVAVMGAARQAALPDVPTLPSWGWWVLKMCRITVFLPQKARLRRPSTSCQAVAKVLTLPEVRERLTAMGLSVGYMTAAQLASREQAYAKTWARIIKDSGFKAQ